MMKKTEIFAEILAIVSRETEVLEGEILSKIKIADVVDARFMLVKSLVDYGFYPGEVARLMKVTSRSIHYTLSNFDTRMDYAKYNRNCYDRIKKAIGSNSFGE